jgi:hypothetical protein
VTVRLIVAGAADTIKRQGVNVIFLLAPGTGMNRPRQASRGTVVWPEQDFCHFPLVKMKEAAILRRKRNSTEL